MKIAVIWASNNTEKYWYKILKDLIDKWYTVFPVNPREEIICWKKVYKYITDIKQQIDVFNFVIKPKIALAMLERNKDFLKDKKIWFQPGSSDDKIKAFLKENWFTDYITDSCIMLEKIR